MAIQKVISYIECAISSINEQESKKNHKSKNALLYVKVLNRLLHLLKESDDGKNVESLQEAISFLERIPVKNDFLCGDTLLGELLKEKNYRTLHTLSELDRMQASTPPINNSREQELGSIHITLAGYLRFLFLNKPTWTFPYPLENNEQVMNDPIGIWQDDRMTLSSEPLRAFRDYLRDISLRGLDKKEKSIAQIDAKLCKMVDNASGYDTDEKELIKNWLRAMGGQGTNRFVDRLIENNHFTDPENENDGWVLAHSIPLEQHWYPENGKISGCFDILILALRKGIVELMYADPNDKQSEDPVKIATEFDELENYPKEKLKPILRNKAFIKLDIAKVAKYDEEQQKIVERKIVKPKIISLDAVGYTNFLKSPERFMKPREFVEERKTNLKMN